MTTPTTPPERDRILEHSYDGIQEYDNPMPQWWVTTFWITIAFAVLYYVNPGNVGTGAGRVEDYEKEMAAFRAAHPQNTGVGDVRRLLAAADRREDVAKGKTVFAGKCAACHAADGGGLIGPNLADDAWIHGGTVGEIYTTVNNGVLAKGMPAWGKLLKPDELEHVVAYVWTLHGTSPAKPKAAEGVVVKR